MLNKAPHGEIEVLKFQILSCKYLSTSYLSEIFDSSTHPFFTEAGCSFVLYKYKI